ncbi:hypothetical protein [Paenibacillus sp. PAMC 26794]|uniref:hypothetical protein n=1 Tax=Paenibacillus sp. PAMC 26794 TaxID=1257080 RepID=UPI0002E3432E|nr:hypothetical protein [Paenibacillus sp. PAMC 26794]
MMKRKILKTLLTAGAITIMLPMAANAQSITSVAVSDIGSNYDSGEILSQEEANSVKENAVPITKIQTLSSELTTDEISAKITEIADKYEIGEIFSDEDANFIKLHAAPVNQTPTIQPSNVVIGDAKKYFVGNFNKVELTGHGESKIGFINNSVSGNFIIRDINQAYHKSIGSVVEFRAFGAFGEGGTKVGLVYSKDYTNSAKNANYNKNVFEDSYVASVAYANYSVRGLVDGYSFMTSIPGE